MLLDGLLCRTELVQQTIWEQVQSFGNRDVTISQIPNNKWSVRINTPDGVYSVEHLTDHTKAVLIQTAGQLGIEYEK
ncbi:MAG: hypothetical protein WCR40_02570 [Candidatus Paceibacterota bacterium]|nr:hypothetical protein [Bacteroides sp.]